MSTVPATPKTVSITIPPTATPAHKAAFWLVFAEILAVIQKVEPVVINFLPAPVALGLEVATAVEPIIISTVQPVPAGS